MSRPLLGALIFLLTLTAGAGFFAFNGTTGTGRSKLAAFLLLLVSLIGLAGALALAYVRMLFID